MTEQSYSFGFLDEYAKREIRRAMLKALAIPGYQVPYASREMPMGRGFGTGGLQLTLSLIGPGDTLKVIDQGSDESVNAVNLRQFISLTCPGIATTMETEGATVIQSRHRIPELPLEEDQILVLQVPYPDPLFELVPSEKRRKMIHAEADYAILWVKLYEDLVTYDEITLSNRYPTRINGRYVLDPSPIPRFDVPKLNLCRAPVFFGAGREKKIYAVPPYTPAEPLSFEDRPFRVESFTAPGGGRLTCRRCGCGDSYLDEFITESGAKVFQCSDLAYCNANLNRRKFQPKASHEENSRS